MSSGFLVGPRLRVLLVQESSPCQVGRQHGFTAGLQLLHSSFPAVLKAAPQQLYSSVMLVHSSCIAGSQAQVHGFCYAAVQQRHSNVTSTFKAALQAISQQPQLGNSSTTASHLLRMVHSSFKSNFSALRFTEASQASASRSQHIIRRADSELLLCLFESSNRQRAKCKIACLRAPALLVLRAPERNARF